MLSNWRQFQVAIVIALACIKMIDGTWPESSRYRAGRLEIPEKSKSYHLSARRGTGFEVEEDSDKIVRLEPKSTKTKFLQNEYNMWSRLSNHKDNGIIESIKFYPNAELYPKGCPKGDGLLRKASDEDNKQRMDERKECVASVQTKVKWNMAKYASINGAAFLREQDMVKRIKSSIEEVVILHKKGVVHGNLCLETLGVTERRKVVLMGLDYGSVYADAVKALENGESPIYLYNSGFKKADKSPLYIPLGTEDLMPPNVVEGKVRGFFEDWIQLAWVWYSAYGNLPWVNTLYNKIRKFSKTQDAKTMEKEFLEESETRKQYLYGTNYKRLTLYFQEGLQEENYALTELMARVLEAIILHAEADDSEMMLLACDHALEELDWILREVALQEELRDDSEMQVLPFE